MYQTKTETKKNGKGLNASLKLATRLFSKHFTQLHFLHSQKKINLLKNKIKGSRKARNFNIRHLRVKLCHTFYVFRHLLTHFSRTDFYKVLISLLLGRALKGACRR